MLVARLDSLGDVLLAGPAVRAVAAVAEVVMLCGPRGAEAARLLPGVSEVIVWNAPWIANPAPAATAEHHGALVRLVRGAAVSEAVILTSFHQSPLPLALLLRSAGVERISGASVDYAGSLLDVRLRPGEDLPEDIPEPQRALAIVGAAGFPQADDGALRVRAVPDVRELTGPGPYVVLHPGADAPARQWPIEGFAETARLLESEGRRVVLTGSGDERLLTRRILERAPGALDLAGACSLPQLAGVLAAASAVVCGNTGPAHLAAAVGTPVVSLFSPVVPAVRWAPSGVPLRLLGDQAAPCRGSRARVCPVPGHPCLAAVSPDAVLSAVTEIERPAPLRIPAATTNGAYE
ncbi:glycosyltransferase family 9 protein [Leucobacter ruminantium]